MALSAADGAPLEERTWRLVDENVLSSGRRSGRAAQVGGQPEPDFLRRQSRARVLRLPHLLPDATHFRSEDPHGG